MEDRDVFENSPDKKMATNDNRQSAHKEVKSTQKPKTEPLDSKAYRKTDAFDKKGANIQKTASQAENQITGNQNPKPPAPIYFEHSSQYQAVDTDIFSKIKTMRDKNRRLNTENVNMQHKLAEAREINSALHKELNEAIDGLLENKMLEDRIAKADEKIAEQQAEIERLKIQLTSNVHTEDATLPSHSELEEQNFFLKVQIESLHEKFEGKFMKLKERLEKGGEVMVNENQALKERAESLETEKSRLKTAVEDINKKLSKADERIESEKQRANGYQIDTQEVLKDLEEAVEERSKLKSDIKNLKAKLEAFDNRESKVDLLKGRLEDCEDQIDTLENQLNSEKEINAELRDCIDSMEQKLNNLILQEEQDKKSSEDAIKLTKDHVSVKEEIKRLSYKIDRLNHKVFGKEVLVDRLQLYAAEDSGLFDGSLFKSVNSCLDAIVNRVDNLISEHSDLRKSNTIYVNSSREKEADNRRLSEENQHIKQELSAYEYEITDLKEELNGLEEKCAGLEQTVKTQKEEFAKSSTQIFEAEVKRFEDKLERLTHEKAKKDLFCSRVVNFVPDDTTRYLVENWVQTTLDIQELEQRLIETQLSTDKRRSTDSQITTKYTKNNSNRRQEIEELKSDIDLKQQKRKQLEAKLLESEEKFKGMISELTALKHETSRLQNIIKGFQVPETMTVSMHSAKNRREYTRPHSSQIRKSSNNVFHDTMDKSKLTSILANFSSTAPLSSKGKEYELIKDKINGLKKKYNLNVKD